ncbi:acetate/propionate family kinase [Bosea sp. BIWAKO-01]|uniref:acetate/propionate family kinase n=1 Tax=Bosea sp. BIWAKO-01 TaxID=506668 RepID=UPI000853EA0F|nr:acetate/propionate family kinase [Bosea sp. BIWAKO-01]GAU81178.1 acetate kinase [Bosea sp. BIWAKO-01]
MNEVLFVVNAGSSSIKFKLYRVAGDDIELMIGGAVDGIGTRPRLKAKGHDGTLLIERSFTVAEVANSAQAQQVVADWVTGEIRDMVIIGIGHRVVHGGPVYSAPVLVDDAVMKTLETFIPLAPLHQLSNLDPIRVLRQRRPDLPQVACFDTAFHRGHPELSDRFALPRALYDEGVRRYGFHGLSYEYVSQALYGIAPEIADKRVIIAHLGSGSSVCALQGGRSIETTMGFTALDGLPMGTRSGSLDPGVVLHLIEQKGMSPAAVGHMLYQESGLLGLSGISNDVRELLDSERPEAAMAIDFFSLRVAQAIASLSVTLGGIDGIVFTAGVGENAWQVRQNVVDRLHWAGQSLKAEANRRNDVRIDAERSRTPIFVVATDEERMIARHTLRLLRTSGVAGREPARS